MKVCNTYTKLFGYVSAMFYLFFSENETHFNIKCFKSTTQTTSYTTRRTTPYFSGGTTNITKAVGEPDRNGESKTDIISMSFLLNAS